MEGMGAQQALEELLDGNRRFVEGRAQRPRASVERREQLAAGQAPFAAVIGCSDSRVPPEIIFDCGLGDLFVVRVAGNVVDDFALGSVEYAVEHAPVRLVLVLGHTSCVAVTAVVNGLHASGHVTSLLTALRPAFVLAQGEAGDLLNNAIRANVRRTVERVRVALEIGPVSPVVVTGAVYHLDTGVVEML